MASTCDNAEDIEASDRTMAAAAAAAVPFRSTPRVAFDNLHPSTAALSSAGGLHPPPSRDNEPLSTPAPKVVRSSPSVPFRHKLGSARVQPITNYQSASTRSLHSVPSSPICRICHETGAREALLSPCKCRGTVGLVHRSCIERWLSTANVDSCEICRFRYRTWLTSRSEMPDLRNLLGDICCFVLLTPLTAVSAWLCISGAVHYSNLPVAGSGQWETVGLLSLSVFLIIVYSIWCLVAGRYHARVFVQWRRLNQIVILMLPAATEAVLSMDDRPRPATAERRSPPARAQVTVPQDTVPPDMVDRQPLYSRRLPDGRWMFGRLPATSVSDTATSPSPAIGTRNISWASKHSNITAAKDRQQTA